MSDDEYSAEKPQSGGCGTKLVMTVGICFAVFGVLVCAGGYFFVQKMKDAITTEPAKIQEISDSVVDLDVPPLLKPQFGMNFKMAGTGMSMAIFADEASGSSMFLMSVPAPYDPASADVENVKRDMEQQQQQQNQGQQQKIIELEEQEEIEKDVNGRVGKFLVGRGKDAAGVDHIQVLGIFESKSNEMGMLNLVVPEEHMDMEAGRKLVESVK